MSTNGTTLPVSTAGKLPPDVGMNGMPVIHLLLMIDNHGRVMRKASSGTTMAHFSERGSSLNASPNGMLWVGLGAAAARMNSLLAESSNGTVSAAGPVGLSFMPGPFRATRRVNRLV